MAHHGAVPLVTVQYSPDSNLDAPDIDSMCVQVDRQFACGHIGFFNIRWCPRALNGCKGPSHKHDIIYVMESCPDCVRKENLPKPWVAR
ncbi:hypothetical protein B0J15DRAFT_27238 [Fusarium solani]|uniref:Uncharacterized protein n=1 Tax=Fusarium solani TaxID=169388 RepID=A0A9P9RES7_FUSSL|nr:uncharacterized protein B0J15DRAFT_27238 [Fusarium solani]KAH7275858.1 hypothetical protein B0J15DRAFT_27238 [Fusarium solani]